MAGASSLAAGACSVMPAPARLRRQQLLPAAPSVPSRASPTAQYPAVWLVLRHCRDRERESGHCRHQDATRHCSTPLSRASCTKNDRLGDLFPMPGRGLCSTSRIWSTAMLRLVARRRRPHESAPPDAVRPAGGSSRPPRPRPPARRSAAGSPDRRAARRSGPPRISAHSQLCAWRARRGGELAGLLERLALAQDRLPDRLDALVVQGGAGQDLGRPGRASPAAADAGPPDSRPCARLAAASRSPSALLTSTRSASSMMPRLMPCSSSPPPGASRSDEAVDHVGDRGLALADADRLDHDHAVARRLAGERRLARAARDAAQRAAGRARAG